MRWRRVKRHAIAAAILAGALFLAPFSAFATSPSPDGTCGNSTQSAVACPFTQITGGATTGTVTFSTTGSAGCLVVFVGNSKGSAVTVSSVAMTSGTGTVGSFTKRTSISGTGTGQFGSSTDSFEEWSAPYTAQLTSAVITVTVSAAIDATTIQGIAAKGTYNNGCAFDPQAATTASGNLVNSTFTVTQSTTNADDMLISALLGDGAQAIANATFGGVSGNLVTTGTIAANGSCCANTLAVNYLGVSTAQSSISTIGKIAGSANYYGHMIADALTADAPVAPTGSPSNRLLLMGVGQ